MLSFKNRIKIIRSKRKTVELRITQDAFLIVRVPDFATNEEVEKIILSYSCWIEKNLARAMQRKNEIPNRKFVNGEKFLYLGKKYTFNIVKGSSEHLKFKNEFFLGEKFVSHARNEFLNWYKKKAFEILSERVEYFFRTYDLEYKKVGITSAKKRWGSCSAKKNLNFSYRLVMAPVSVIDYVVVHELVHTVEMNHSKRFWNIVGSIMPDFKNKRDWLKENGYKLMFY